MFWTGAVPEAWHSVSAFRSGRRASMVEPLQRLAFIAVLCWAASLHSSERLPRVMTSFFPLYCWTANIAGHDAQVECLLSSRAEPHDYAFTPGDARRLHDADLIVVNGLGLEAWMPKFLRSSLAAQERIVVATPGMDQSTAVSEHYHEHRHGDHNDETQTSHANPHVWLDPVLAAHGVSNILKALQRTHPARATAYGSNAQIYAAKLVQLDRDIRDGLAA